MVPLTFHASGREMQSFTSAVLVLCGVKNLQTVQSFMKPRPSRHHDVKTAAILDPPSWISIFFQNARKPPKTTAKYSKSIKMCFKPVKM